MTFLQARRSLARTPAFTIAIVLTLGVGIASLGSMFAIVYGVLLAPLPYAEPDRLVSIRLQAAGSGEIKQPPALQQTYTQLATTLDGVGFYRSGSTNLWVQGSADGADSVVAAWTSASMMPLLGVAPLLGRSFTAEEELRSGPEAVILSEGEWRTRFNAAADVLGKTVLVNSVPRQVVGVMPARFSFPDAQTRIWLPAKRVDTASVGEFNYTGVGRLAAGADAGQAQRDLASVLPQMAASFPRLDSGAATATWLADVRPTPIVEPLREAITRDIAGTLWMLAAAAGLVLLVAWANVANLLLIHADARRPELAVRAVLGAGRGRIALQFAGEALLLGAMAGVLALVLVGIAVKTLLAFGPAGIPRLAELGVGLPAVAFVVLTTLAGIALCTVVPAARGWRAGMADNLREGGRGASTGRSGNRVRAVITTLQIALALVVTIGAALLLRTAHGLYQVNPGFDATSVMTVRTQLPFARYDEAAAVAFYARLTERVRELPSVRDAGVVMKLPLGSGAVVEQVFTIGVDGQPRSLPVNVVGDDYFAALSIPLLAGSGFRHTGLEQGRDVIISRHAAAALFGDGAGTESVGQRLTLAPSGLDYTVIGVVGDVRDQDLATPPSIQIYRPLQVSTDTTVEPAAPRNMALVVKSDGPATALVPAIRRIIHAIDPSVPAYSVEAMEDVARASTARLSLVLALMTTAAAITLLLATIGLYGVMAYMVALRTREFGVRGALGADPRRIARLVAGRGLALTVGGVAIGFVLYAVAAPLLQSFLFDVTVTDPATLLAATLVLVGTATLASWLPARRAARIDPVQALRAA